MGRREGKMRKYKTVYIGHVPMCAEYIYHSDVFELTEMICEQNRMTDELLTFSLVRQIPLNRIKGKKGLCEKIQEFGKETVFIMHGFGLRVPMELLNGYRVFNIHESDLPKYKGAQPTYWATIKNEKQIGVSLFQITDQFEDGVIVAQEKFPYYIWENEYDIQKKTMDVMPKLLQGLETYLENNIIIKENMPGDYYPKVSKKDVFIDLEKDSPQVIFNKVRAEAAFGGAKLNLYSGEDMELYCIKEILFSEECMKESFEINEEGILKIRYTDELVLIVNKYDRMQEAFKFRGE